MTVESTVLRVYECTMRSMPYMMCDFLPLCGFPAAHDPVAYMNAVWIVRKVFIFVSDSSPLERLGLYGCTLQTDRPASLAPPSDLSQP